MRSAEYVQKQYKQLEQRLEKTEQALRQLVKRRQGYQYPKSGPELAEKVSRILVTQECAAYLKVNITEEIEAKQRRQYKNRPARAEQRTNFQLHISRQEKNLAQKQRLMGWRGALSNADVPPQTGANDRLDPLIVFSATGLNPDRICCQETISGARQLFNRSLRRKQKSKTPQTETLLAVFKGIILTIIQTKEKE